MSNYNKEYFQETFHNFDADYKWARIRIKPILKIIDRGCNALDIGCSYGHLVKALMEVCPESFGVDINAYAISKAPHELKMRLMVLDVRKQRLPFPDNFFGVVTALEVFEHLSSVGLLLREIYRVLRPCGYVYATIPQKEGGEKTHINIHTKDWWLNKFNEYNFKVIGVGTLYLPWEDCTTGRCYCINRKLLRLGKTGRLVSRIFKNLHLYWLFRDTYYILQKPVEK